MNCIVEFPAKEILRNLVTARYNHHAKRIFIACPEGLVPVKTASQRYRLFKKKKICKSCGRIGTVARLESSEQKGRITYYFNFYCVEEDRYILMTKDHILPKSLGGRDSLSNYQTMCFPCNSKKADRIISERVKKAFLCMDCGKDTFSSKEYYSLNDPIWKSICTKDERGGMLCLSCAQVRLGRKLVEEDFKPTKINLKNPVVLSFMGETSAQVLG